MDRPASSFQFQRKTKRKAHGTRTQTYTISNGTKASASGLSGLRAIAQKGKNGRRGVVGGGVGHCADHANKKDAGG